MQQGQKRTLESDAYSETSSPKRAMSEDPSFASDGASSSASRSPPPARVEPPLVLDPALAPSTAEQQQQQPSRQHQQQIAEGRMEDLHLSSDGAEEDAASHQQQQQPSPPADDEEATSQATVAPASSLGSVSVATSAMGDELEREIAAEQQAERGRSLTHAEKLEMITNLRKQPLNAGDFWFLVERKWYRRFADLLESSPDAPLEALAPLTNAPLLDGAGQLRPLLQEGSDVEIVPENAWRMLVDWFTGDHEIKRKVIAGAQPGNERVEFYEPTITVHFIDGGVDPKNLVNTFVKPFQTRYSSAAPFKVVFSALCRAQFSIAPADARLWLLERGSGPHDAILSVDEAKAANATVLTPADDRETLESMLIADGSVLAVEWRGVPPGPWPMMGETDVVVPAAAAPQQPAPLFGGLGYLGSLESRNAVASGSGAGGERRDEGGSARKMIGSIAGMLTRSKASGPEGGAHSRNGLVGLSNLGNTCFMNSAIQCMSNTTLLNKYFLTGVYKDELNRSNPLGMKGQVADAFGELIAKLHHGASSSFSPSEFKRTLARFAPSFSGYQQHDSQEFITFLLDGLHEDLNRIKKKPYVESPDWHGGGDGALARLAKDCWDIYKKRNDSVIVDLFQGQYKSTLVCPKCAKVSITFDPFMYLTLPVPVKKKMQAEVFFVPASGPRFKVELSVPKETSFKGVKALLGRWFDRDPSTMLAVELWHSTIYKSFADHDMFGEIAAGDVIVFYEVATKINLRDTIATVADQGTFVIPVFTTRADSNPSYGSNRSAEPVGAPFFITLTLEQAVSVEAITQAIVDQYARLLPESEHAKLARPASAASAAGASQEPSLVDEDMANVEDAVGEDDDELFDGHVEQIQFGMDASSPPVADIFPDSPPAALTPTSTVTSEAPSPATTANSSPAGPSSRTVFDISVFSGGRFGPSREIPDGRAIGELYPLGTPYKSSVRRRHGMQLDSLDSDDEAAGAGPAKDAPPVFVGHGTGIVCAWPVRILHDVIGKKDASAFDMGYEKFTDPSIVAESGKKKTKAVLSIQDCLDEFSREETLGEDDLWYCSTCKEHQAATKKLELWKTPDILVVHLKRFGGSRGLRDKIDNLIEFPVTDFDLSDRVQERQVAQRIELAGEPTEELGLESTEEPVIYDLYGVDQHFGGLGGGHYTAAAKSGDDGKWYSFDDSRVSPISDPQSVVTPAAYVLFYRRRVQSREIGGDTRMRVEAAIRSRSAAPSPAPSGTQTPTSAVASGRSSPAGGLSASVSHGWGRFASSAVGRLATGPEFNVSPYPMPLSPADSTADLAGSSSLSDAPSSASSASSAPDADAGPAGHAESDDNDWTASEMSTSPALALRPYPASPAESESLAAASPAGASASTARPPVDDDYDGPSAPASAGSAAGSSTTANENEFVMVDKPDAGMADGDAFAAAADGRPVLGNAL